MALLRPFKPYFLGDMVLGICGCHLGLVLANKTLIEDSHMEDLFVKHFDSFKGCLGDVPHMSPNQGGYRLSVPCDLAFQLMTKEALDFIRACLKPPKR